MYFVDIVNIGTGVMCMYTIYAHVCGCSYKMWPLIIKKSGLLCK